MTRVRMIDLLKLAPLTLAAALLAGCSGADEAAPPADDAIGAEGTAPAVVEPAEPAPADADPIDAAPVDEPTDVTPPAEVPAEPSAS